MAAAATALFFALLLLLMKIALIIIRLRMPLAAANGDSHWRLQNQRQVYTLPLASGTSTTIRAMVTLSLL